MKTLTVEDVSEILSWHPDTVRRKACTGELPAAKVGKRFIFLEEDIIAWIRSQYVKPINLESMKPFPKRDSEYSTLVEQSIAHQRYYKLLGLGSRRKRKSRRSSE